MLQTMAVISFAMLLGHHNLGKNSKMCVISVIKTQGQSRDINSSPNNLSNAGQTQKRELVYNLLNKYCCQMSLQTQKQVKKTGKVFLAVKQTNTSDQVLLRGKVQ